MHATPPRSIREERILVLAPTSADAALTRTILDEAGLHGEDCPGLTELCRAAAAGAGALLLTEEVLEDGAACLVDLLARQPPWSDVPILLLTSRGADSSVAAWAMELLGSVTVLERPVRVTTLVSSLRTALRARRRQYELRSRMEALRKQSERLRLLWDAASVLLSNDQPDGMMRGLFANIAPHLGLDAYFNFMVDEAGQALHLESCLGISDEEARKISRLDFGEAICGTVAQCRMPITAVHIQQSDDPKVQLAKSYGLRVYTCNPLLAGGRLLGTLSFASRSRDSFDADEQEFLETVCRYVAYAYERLRLIRQLRAEDEKKDEFLATLAHELRNPLAPIRNAAYLMRLKESADPELQNARDIIDRQVQQMNRLVDDLLDISRITRGKIVLQRERVSVDSVLKNAVESSRPWIDDAGHTLTVALPSETLMLEGDPTRLAQVFSNLLTNAAKYTDRGGHISITARRQGNNVIVSVQDDGIGIAPEHVPRLFDMFSQVAPALERSQGGLGIGLALVRSLVDMHGGRVEARSEGLGRGSEFLVQLPCLGSLPTSPVGDDERPPAHNTGPASCRIVVADDNVDAAQTLAMILSVRGHDVRTAHDGMTALDLAESFRPDIMVLDIGMPRLNGYEVARRIRQQPWGAKPLLVALTGWGQEEDKRRARAAGFNRHFTKPVDTVELQRLLEETFALGSTTESKPMLAGASPHLNNQR